MSGVQQAVFQNQRSFGGPPDAQFNYVTMLLHGDGTNGAQNNTFLDSSTNNFTITRNGNTTQGSFSPYGSNWSNYFNGTTDYLNTASITIGTGNFTLEAWQYTIPNSSNYGRVFGVGGMFSSTGLGLNLNPSTMRFELVNNNTTIINPAQTYSYNSWNHLAVVRSGTTITLYINGVSQGTATNSNSLSGSIYTSAIDYLGTIYYGASYTSNIRLTNTAVYTSAFTPSTTPLTAISGTQFLSSQSNRYIDNSSNAYAITVNGTPSVQRFNPFGTATAYSTSVIGGSGYFDGSGDYLTIPSTSAFNFGSNNFTVEFWWNTTTSGQNIINPTGTGNGWAILISSGSLGWNDSYNVTALFTVNATSILDNAWHHVAFVRLSGTTYVYFDGVLKATNADPTVYSLGATDWYIGKGNVADFNGYMCDLRINNGTAVYTSAFTPPTAPLTAITNTQLLTNFTNGAIFDNAMINDLQTVGNAQISTSVKKYGTGSLAFDGAGDYLTGKTVPIGSGDLTIECWVYLNVATGDQHFVQVDGASDSNVFLSLDSGANKFKFVVRNDAGTNNISITSSISPSASTWYHIAGVVSGSNAYLFVDGSTTSGATGTLSGTRSGTGTNAYLGVNGSGGFRPLNGYLDDVRITKGYARYTANFTPPTVALSDTGPY